MMLLRKLIGSAMRTAVQDPRVRRAAKEMYEERLKPKAQAAWENAKPQMQEKWEQTKPKVEEAWARTKPVVAEATRKAGSEAGKLAGQVKQAVRARAAKMADDR